MEAAEQALLLAQYSQAAQQAYAIATASASRNDQDAIERALFIVVQAMCLEGRHQAAFDALQSTYGTSKRMPARLLGLWWLLNDNCSLALDTVLTHCHRVNDPAALLALLCQQAYGRKGHAKLTAFLRDNTSTLISDDVRQVCLGAASQTLVYTATTQTLLDTLKDVGHDSSPATTPAASTSTTECADDDATAPEGPAPRAEEACCCSPLDTSPLDTQPVQQPSMLLGTHAQHAWHSAGQWLATAEGQTTALKVGVGTLAALVVAAAAFQERKAIARAVRRAGATLQQELRSTLGMATSVVPNPLSQVSQLQSRL